MDTAAYLAALNLPSRDAYDLPTSAKRFPSGGQYRVEISSCEGPDVLQEVVEAAQDYGVPVHRVSQGSGIMLQTDAEIERMVKLGAENGIEVCVFTGPRAAWDVGVQASTSAGSVARAVLRGADQLGFGVEDVRHGCDLGLRSVLVADLGQLWVLAQMKNAGELPEDLILKVSISMPVTNPATARVFEDLGANTLNLPVDLSLPQIAAIRQAVNCPIDLYIESGDGNGGTVRHYEIPEIVRVAAPVHLKFGLRNAPNLYPSGGHLSAAALSGARERVRRAAIGLGILARYYPDAICDGQQTEKVAAG
jgi:Peptidase family U32